MQNKETIKKKKVVHITTVHPPFDTRIFYKECVSLAQDNFEVYLIHTKSENFDANKFKENKIKPVLLNKPSNRLNRIIKSTKLALKEALKLKADIYHLHDPELLLIANKLKKSGAMVVYDMHEDYYTSIEQKKYIFKPLRLLIANLFRTYEKRKLKNLKLIIAEKYYKDSFPQGKTILNYPVLENNYKGISFKNNNRLLYTGNVTEDRGALIHSEIPTYVDGVKVKFVGKCSSKVANKMKRFEEQKDRIEIKGVDEFISREEIDKEYNNNYWLAGLAIFPPTEHYMEKELTKFFEYMYAGLPMIVSDFPKWKEFVEKHQCGIAVKYNNRDEIKAAINYFNNNPDIAKKMGENGQKAIIEELNWSKEAQKLIDLYKSFS